jgi:predicted DNA-binding protein YlxM (UPF0122 family)
MKITYKELLEVFDSKSLVTLKNNLAGQFKHIDSSRCELVNDAIIEIVIRAKKEGVINVENAATQLGLADYRMRDLVAENKLTYFGFGNKNPKILFFAETFNSETKGIAKTSVYQSYNSIQDLKLLSNQLINIITEEQLIDKRLIEIINLYDKGSSLNEIAEEFGITRERARQLIERAKRKIREILVNCLTNYATTKDTFYYVDSLQQENKRLKEMVAPKEYNAMELVHIQDLDLSVRLYNVLSMQRLFTIKDIKEFIEKGGNLYRLRNFGTKSMNELECVMKEHNVRI